MAHLDEDVSATSEHVRGIEGGLCLGQDELSALGHLKTLLGIIVREVLEKWEKDQRTLNDLFRENYKDHTVILNKKMGVLGF